MNDDCWQNLCSTYENVLCDLWFQTRFLICCMHSGLKFSKIVQQGITNMYFNKVSTNNNTDTTFEKF